LEAILEPSKVISDQYAAHTVLAEDGTLAEGLLAEDGDELVVYTRDPSAQPVHFARSEVKLVKPSPLSQMPAGLVDPLNPDELRDLLATTVALQSRFLAQRMEAALPKLLAATSAARRAHVKKQFEKLAANGKGTFALIDYVNFKGEGTKPEERYNGRGWGLLQVIEGMDDEGSIAESFAASAARVLAQRVKNSPPERDEAKWLPGWVRRVEAYAR
jgi:hypothetical protein